MFTAEDIVLKGILDVRRFDAAMGKITVITGESGSGKSTLLRLLDKMAEADSGTIRFLGKDIREIPSVELRRRAIMLPQHPVLFGATVEECLQAPSVFAEKELPGREEMEKVLDAMHLDKKPEERTGSFSGGEKQRLALAAAVLADAEAYLLDEPSSALDKKTERKVMDSFFGFLGKNKKTAVVVTHSAETAGYGDVVYEMSGGMIAGGSENGYA